MQQYDKIARMIRMANDATVGVNVAESDRQLECARVEVAGHGTRFRASSVNAVSKIVKTIPGVILGHTFAYFV